MTLRATLDVHLRPAIASFATVPVVVCRAQRASARRPFDSHAPRMPLTHPQGSKVASPRTARLSLRALAVAFAVPVRSPRIVARVGSAVTTLRLFLGDAPSVAVRVDCSRPVVSLHPLLRSMRVQGPGRTWPGGV